MIKNVELEKRLYICIIVLSFKITGAKYQFAFDIDS